MLKRSFTKLGLITLFLVYFVCGTIHAQRATNPLEERIIRLDKTVRDKGAIVGLLTAQQLDKLPIGIMDPMGQVVICIDSAVFTPNGGHFNAYAAIPLPGNGRKMCFRAANIPFGPNGLVSSDMILLTLVADVDFPIGDVATLRLPGNGNNNVQWDCNGFREANIEGQFIFRKEYFKPDSIETSDTAVTASLRLQHIVNFNNLLASVSITPFKIRGMDDFGFKVREATMDMSDYANPEGFNFPANYLNEYGSNFNLWRGFSLRNITVRTPFVRAGGPVSVFVENMLIDDNGVSGIAGATNLLSIAEGSANGWNFGIDTFKVEVLRNRLVGGSLIGELKVPFLGDKALGYKAQVSQWNDDIDYLFQVNMREADTFGLPLGLKATLKAGTYVQLQKYRGNLVASALLHGRIYSDSGVIKFGGIRFENVGLSTVSPFIHSGVFDVGGPIPSPSLAGFDITFDSIRLGIANGQLQLASKVSFNFMEDSARGFGAHAGFVYKGHFEEDSVLVKRQRFVGDGLTINDIGVRARLGSFELDGTISLYRSDPVYGNGFSGSLSVKFSAVGEEVRLAAQAYFGRAPQGYRYFQISGFAQVGTGFPVIPGVLYLNGLLGGISYHMTKPQSLKSPFLLTAGGTMVSTPDLWARQTYVPSGNIGLGIILGTTFYIGQKDLASGGVSLEIELNNNWGINYVSLKGTLAVFKDVTKGGASQINDGSFARGTPLYAELNVIYDRPNQTFHANLSTYLNMAVFKGAGPNNLFGEMVIHLDPNSWYYYIGRPTKPIGAKINLGPLGDLITVQAYFMVGSLLDPFPPPPQEFLQYVDYDPHEGSLGALASGNGVALGAKINVYVGFDWGFVYANVRGLAGGDVMLSTSGNYTCSGEAVGIGGWWARGRVYAMVEGNLGIRVKIFLVKVEFEILHLAAGALLEAKVPKPSFFDGYMFLKWRFLAGLISGSLNFHISFGKECPDVLQSTAPQQPGGPDQGRDLSLKVLGAVYPDANSTNVDLTTIPTVVTNIPIDNVFEGLNENGVSIAYKVLSKDLCVKKGNQIIPATEVRHDGGKTICFTPRARLLPETEYVISGKFKYMKQLGHWDTTKNSYGVPSYDDDGNLLRRYVSDGAWTDVVDSLNNPVQEAFSSKFTTGPPVNYFDITKIEYAYPCHMMQNFYKEEYSGPSYFKVTDEVDMSMALYASSSGGISYEYKMKITGLDTSPPRKKWYVDFTRNDHLITYSLPPGLENGKGYRAALVRRRMDLPVDNDGMGIMGSTSTTTANAGQGYTDTTQGYTDTILTSTITGGFSQGEIELVGFDFRISKYNTFSEKLASFSHYDNVQDISEGNALLIGNRRLPLDETFARSEMRSITDHNFRDQISQSNVSFNQLYLANFPLVKSEALPGNYWLDSVIIPAVYPILSPATVDETFFRGNVAGSPDMPSGYSYDIPYRSIALEQNDYSANYPVYDPESPLAFLNGISNTSQIKFVIKYNLPYYLNKDFLYIYNLGALMWATGDRTYYYRKLVETGGIFPQITNGTYQVKLTYRTPGGIHTSEHLVDINY